MKALIISDLHSNIFALEAIWKQEKDSDIIYCAGDLVDYGPYPKEVIDWVRDHNVICVRGNHDERITSLYRNKEELWGISDEERTWAYDNAQKLNDADIEFLEKLPKSISFSMDSIGYTMQHMYIGYETIQTLFAYKQFWEQNAESSVGQLENKRMIFGHTHKRTVQYLSDQELWMNPGSISYRRPDEPSKEAHYITITDGKISMKSLEYDRTPLLQATMNTTLKYKGQKEVTIYFFGDGKANY